MPYIGGETPKLGDYVKNQYEQPGTVKRLDRAKKDKERDLDLPLSVGRAEQFPAGGDLRLTDRRKLLMPAPKEGSYAA
jgi:hypothetical protein